MLQCYRSHVDKEPLRTLCHHPHFSYGETNPQVSQAAGSPRGILLHICQFAPVCPSKGDPSVSLLSRDFSGDQISAGEALAPGLGRCCPVPWGSCPGALLLVQGLLGASTSDARRAGGRETPELPPSGQPTERERENYPPGSDLFNRRRRSLFSIAEVVSDC